MKRYFLLIGYDGSSFCGWQRQPNGISIQELLEKALSILLKEPIAVTGSGRTDSGVHATAQVAHFDSSKEFDSLQLRHQLNALLPKEIRILKIGGVDPLFHARFSAIGKEYHYHLWLDKPSDPFLYRYRYYLPFEIELSLLLEGTQFFCGTHDFTTFTNTGTPVKDFVRTIYRIDIVPQQGGVRLEFEGDGFLYKMVRNIVGTLLEVASKRRSLESLQTLALAKDRRHAGVAAPAHALFLQRVIYPKDYEWINATTSFMEEKWVNEPSTH